MTIELVPFDPRKASREEWNRFHPYRRRRHQEEEPGDPVPADWVAEALMKRQDPQSDITRLAVMDTEHPEAYVGSLYFAMAKEGTPTWEENQHNAWVDLELVSEYRGRGIGRRLLRRAVELARERGRTLLIGGTHEDDGKAFLRAIGGQVGLRTRQSRLDLEEVDWEMVEAWSQEGPERSPGTELEHRSNLMEGDFLEAYCDLMTEVFNQAPRGDIQAGDEVFQPDSAREWVQGILDAGGTKLTVLTRESNGTLSGVTEVGCFPDQPAFIRQYMTGVREQYRGRGLGKWLKAAMLLRVREEYPSAKVVTTGNATTNAPMLSINERLGFRPHWEGVIAQVSVEDLETYLGQGSG